MSQASLPKEERRTLAGGCLCRKVRYTITLPAGFNDVENSCYCHCKSCRKSCGGMLMGYFYGFAEKDIEYENTQPTAFESSKGIFRAFCPCCGSQIYVKFNMNGTDAYGFTVGSLDDPDSVRVERQAMTEFGVKQLKKLMGLETA
ncbi:uncharacterized protein VTP21DRAFT_7445 [Calcarisporiella thermophila]|uniref:uncharacterized protein n=1 Tax=Calcarisporiella thermophila TaxID=911321 RepID=UPI003743E9FF